MCSSPFFKLRHNLFVKNFLQMLQMHLKIALILCVCTIYPIQSIVYNLQYTLYTLHYSVCPTRSDAWPDPFGSGRLTVANDCLPLLISLNAIISLIENWLREKEEMSGLFEKQHTVIKLSSSLCSQRSAVELQFQN